MMPNEILRRFCDQPRDVAESNIGMPEEPSHNRRLVRGDGWSIPHPQYFGNGQRRREDDYLTLLGSLQRASAQTGLVILLLEPSEEGVTIPVDALYVGH